MVETFATTVTSYALDTNKTWPYVTIPHIEARGKDFLNVSYTHLISIAPIVQPEAINEWNTYSVANQGWIQESYKYREQTGYTNKGYGDSTNNDWNEGIDATVAERIPPQVYRTDEAGNKYPLNQLTMDVGAPFVTPVWQEASAPTHVETINFDLYSHPIFQKVFDFAKETDSAILSPVFNVKTLLGEDALYEVEEDGTIHPESILVQQIYDTFNPATRKVVAALVAVIPWDLFLNRVLHDGANGVVCVLKDTCGDEMTYILYGSQATFVGEGDLHDRKYDELEFVTEFAPFINFDDADDDMVDAHCEYSLHIYPSKDMEDQYHNNKPIFYSIAVVSVFFLTSLVFMFYDYMVRTNLNPKEKDR